MPSAAQQLRLDEAYPGLAPGPNGGPHHLAEPAVLVDCHGTVLAWALPQCMSAEMQVSRSSSARPPGVTDTFIQHEILAASQLLNPRFAVCAGENDNWRKSARLFKLVDDCEHFLPGVVDFAPAWYMQGHPVSRLPLSLTGC